MMHAIIPQPQTTRQIYGALLSAEKWRDDLLRLAAEFHAYDMRPLLVLPSGLIERVGPDPVPYNLREMIHDAWVEVTRLQYAWAASQANVPRP